VASGPVTWMKRRLTRAIEARVATGLADQREVLRRTVSEELRTQLTSEIAALRAEVDALRVVVLGAVAQQGDDQRVAAVLVEAIDRRVHALESRAIAAERS
jgi:hypothetical protein